MKSMKIMKEARTANMAQQKPRTPSSRAGVKTLIAVASVSCTVGGWMYFAATAPAETNTANAQPSQITAQYAQQPAALPTLVPIDDAIAASNAAAAMPQAHSPQLQPQVLRSVAIAQPPMAMSRSSR
jgi:hypothetical protein